MLRTGIDLELLAHCTAERVLRKHALDGMLDHALRMLGHSLFEGFDLQPTRKTAVTIILFGSCLVARQTDLVGIDDDDKVTRIDVRGVLRLVLALQDMSGLGGDAAENLISCIDQDPFALNFVGLCVIRLHFISSILLAPAV